MNIQGMKHSWKLKLLADMNISTQGRKDITEELFWTAEHKGMEDWSEETTLEDLSQRPTAKEQAFWNTIKQGSPGRCGSVH